MCQDWTKKAGEIMNAMTKIDYNPAILAAAKRYVGTEEWAGAASNPAVEELWTKAGFGVAHKDDVPWCAAFVGAVLAQVGLPNTGKPNARSYLEYGTSIDPEQARPGDIIVFWRGSPSGWQGHVAFFAEWAGSDVMVIGGNQSDAVTRAAYPRHKIIGVRRADGVSAGKTLREGNTASSSEVGILQADLKMLGYFAGKIDGLFGPLTRNAVMAFQADNNLTVDGIAGPKTLAAMKQATKPPERAVTEADLRTEGSRTIKAADTTQAGSVALTVGSAGMLALERADDVAIGLDAATGALDKAQNLIFAYWPVLLVLFVGGAIWFGLSNIRKFRTEDARSGANLGR